LQPVSEILNEIKKRRLNISEIARETGIPAQRFHKWVQGSGQPKTLDAEKLKAWAFKNLEEVPSSVREDSLAYSLAKSPSTDVILSLSKSNITLAEANKTLADAHKILARNNEDLIKMLRPTENDVEDIPPAVAASFSGFLELLAQVGSGKRWKTPEEARAAVNKLVLVPGEKS
jgi:transposase-like protein